MIDWENRALLRRLIELVSDEDGYSERQMAEILSTEFGIDISRDAVHNKIRRVNLREFADKPVTDIMPYYTKYREIIEEGDGIPKILEVTEDYIEINKDRLKILYLGDLHIPFQVDEQIQTAINRNINADVVVTNEIADCYSLSRFNKDMSIPFEVEVDNVIRYMEYLSATFPLIFILGANHEDRITKIFQRNIPSALLFLVEENLISLLAKPFNNIIVVPSFLLQINDTIFAHAEQANKVDMKASINVYNTLNEWKSILGVRDYRCLLQGHTHQLGCTYRGSNYKIIEGGCLSYVPDYSVQGFYSRAQTNGYVVIIQNDGVTDFNMTREYYFDTPRYIPKYNPVVKQVCNV